MTKLGELMRADPATARVLDLMRPTPAPRTPPKPTRFARPQPRPQSRAEPRRAPPAGPFLGQDALEPLGRLVIVTSTDLPCNLNIAVARPGDVEGLVCAYIDSDLYNHFGWWFEPTGGGATDIVAFGMRIDVLPRDGAWTFRAARCGPNKTGRPWSPLDVGTSVLHIRFKGLIEQFLRERPDIARPAGMVLPPAANEPGKGPAR